MKRAEAYVTISRHQRLENLYFGEKLPTQTRRNWKVGEDLELELKRLAELSKELVRCIRGEGKEPIENDSMEEEC